MSAEELLDLNSKHPQLGVEKKNLTRIKAVFLVLKSFTITLVILAILVAVISAYTDEILVHPVRMPITTNPRNYGLRYQNVSFLSRVDHTHLRGWFIPALFHSNRTVVFAHGHAANRMQMMSMFSPFVRDGYNIFTFDFRDSGESDGTIDTVGYLEQWDLEGAFDYVRIRPQNQGRHIGFLGFSMGAAVSILVAANEPGVEGVVADSSFANLQQYLEANLSKYSHLPSFPFTPVMEWLSIPLTGLDPAKVQPIKSIARIAPRPLLLIHGEADMQVSPDNSKELFAAAHNPNAQLWMVPNADHVQSYKTEPAAYLEHLLTFFGKSLASK